MIKINEEVKMSGVTIMLTLHLSNEDDQMVVLFQLINQNKVNSKLLQKQCQNKFEVVSGATIMSP
jgi:hypothetical protein